MLTAQVPGDGAAEWRENLADEWDVKLFSTGTDDVTKEQERREEERQERRWKLRRESRKRPLQSSIVTAIEGKRAV